MVKNRWVLTLILSSLLLVSCSVTAAIDIYEFNSLEKEQQFKALTLQLRCPKCQNNSIADSNSPIATDMRAKIYELIQQGDTDHQIINYMIERYGYFVTYSPPVTPWTLILWLGPILFLILGSGIIVILARRGKSSLIVQTKRLSIQEQQRLARIIDQ